MVAGLAIVPVVSAVTRAPAPARLDQIFACYNRTVTVTVRDSIGENEVDDV